MTDIGELTEALAAVGEKLDRLSVNLEVENEKRDRRIRWSRRATVTALVVAAGALYLGYRAKSTADDIIAARKDARLITCEADNKAAANEHELWEGILDLPRAAGATPPDPNVLAQFHALLDQTFPQRDCSPAAIAAYYAGK